MRIPFIKRSPRSWLGTGRQRLGPALGRPLEIIGPYGVEELEHRVMLDASLPPAIVLGRTLSSYTIGGIQDNQETITLTVYNEQSSPVTGVLVTDALELGVTLLNASQLPDQSGQNLAWSLGTINGFDRVSITLTVSLSDPIPLQLDAGARAFATLDAGMVTNSTPAAVLRPGSVDASLLASTPDANTIDPFIQEEAAALSYNAQNIFTFLHSIIVYNSYLGSVRGARGTLWSNAGNALDVASLGVALDRASGIPAQYVQGTLSSFNAQTLILSMFPASYQLAGYIPAGTTTADPAHDPQLLAETESHYWFQFDTGSGFQNADPLMSATVGSTFASSQGTFTEVPDNLREKAEVSVNAEIYSQANAAFGGTGLKTTTVLAQTFNDVDLIGRPLTFGNFVSSASQGGLVFSTITNTYSPYFELGDDAYDSRQDQLIRGTDYQEVLTNFPLGSQYLTGLFLDFTLTGPQGSAETYSKTLVDRIGFAARQAGGTARVATIDPSAPPVITPFDLYTVSVLAGSLPLDLIGAPGVRNAFATTSLAAFSIAYNAASTDVQTVLGQEASQTIINSLIALQRSETASFEVQATSAAEILGKSNHVVGYLGRPRITIASSQLVPDDARMNLSTLQLGFDLVKSNIREALAPGQSLGAQITFNVLRGVIEDDIEGSVVSTSTIPTATPGLSTPTFTERIFQEAQDQSIPIIVLTPSDLPQVGQLPFSADINARIADALVAGYIVSIPSRSVLIDGRAEVGWFEINPKTGQTVGVLETGSHGALDDYAILLNDILTIFKAGSAIAGFVTGFFAASGGLLGAVEDLLGKDKILLLLTPTQYRAYVKLYLSASAIREGVEVFSKLPSLAKYNPYFVPAYFKSVLIVALRAAEDPPVPNILVGTGAFGGSSIANTSATVSPAGAAGDIAGNVYATNTQVTGKHVISNWYSTATNVDDITSLSAARATLQDANGQNIGAGAITVATETPIPIEITGPEAVSVSGAGSLAFYGPAGSSVGSSGNWDDYAATITGDVSITMTTDGLMLNGRGLPAGTYTITTSSATLMGIGATASPQFSGSASVSVTAGTVNLGPGTGNLTVSGNPVSPTNGVTLTGYSGNLTVSATGIGSDSISLSGSAANVLTVSASPTAITTDQDTPVTFQTNVRTSFFGTYTITAQAPTGWTVSVDDAGNVAVTPAPGLQSGTYPIQIVAQSTTNPDLVAQTTVNVTIKPTAAGITLSVAPDPLTTVPFNGAQLPTAFVESIHNNGPHAITENLTFSNIPSGFTLLDSATSVTIPAGETGSVGIYLMPTSGIPAPGSQFSFNMSAAEPFGFKTTQTVSFTVPAVDAVTLMSALSTVNVAPGAAAADVLTIANVGNEPENITLTPSAATGITFSGQSDINLQPGQSVTEDLTIAAAPSMPLNSLASTTITATYGPSAFPQTSSLQVLVDIAVPGASAIRGAVAAAGQLNENDLAARLSDFTPELTNLVLNPTSPVVQSQVLATLDAVIGLLPTDVYLVILVPALTSDRNALALAANPADVNIALAAIGNDLESVATTLSDEIAHSLVLTLDSNQGQARPQSPVLYPIAIQNTGNQPTTYDFSVSGLPAGVDASFNSSSVTLQPGQYLFGGPNGITLTLTEASGELTPTGFTVTATAEGAPEINRSAIGSLTIRNAFVQVATVTPNPSFSDPGGKVDISARILNVTANPMTAEANYTVTDPGGNVVFTSIPVSVPFSSFVSFPTVDLGSFDTMGLAEGSYTISVLVTDAAGNSITNVPGQASIQIGSPVTASLSLASTNLIAYLPVPQTFTSTIKIGAQTTFPAPLTLNGITATDAPETAVALDGALAYVVGTKDVSIIDVSDPTNPVVEGTFGSDQITQGGYNVCKVVGGLLLIGSQNTVNTNYFNFLIYDISNPLSPVLVSNTQINYHFISDMFILGTTAYFPLNGIETFVNVILTDQFGDFVAVDFSNPAQPRLADVLFNSRGAPDGGDFQENGEAVVNGQLTYVASTTSKGPNSQVGSGELLIVDTSNPAQLAVAGTLTIPDTVQLVDIVIHGNRALAVGSTGGSSITSGAASATLAGNLTLTPLDISDPLHPKIIGPTFVTQDQFFTRGQALGASKLDAVDLGNGVFAISDTQFSGNPQILLVDSTDPNHMVLGAIQTPSIVSGLTVSGSLLYASTHDGLSIYNIGQVLGIPIAVSVMLPTGTAVSYKPSSFNIAPSQIVHGAGFDTITWVSSLGAGFNNLTLTWISSLPSNQPPETLPVALGATLDFSSDGTPGTLVLPGTFVTVPHSSLLVVTPTNRTVQPGASTSYTVFIQRSAADTYNLSVAGLPASWVSLPASVTMPPSNGTLSMAIHPDPAAPPGTYNFTVFATDGVVSDSFQVSVTVQGPPIIPPSDPDSHGVVTELIPTLASAGQGTSASYTVRLTNTGSADDTFALSALGLPAGVTAAFGKTAVDVPSGASNFRDVLLTLTPPIGMAAGSYNFTVTATSTTSPSITSIASGTLNVLRSGVSVALNPPSGAPGAPFQMTVINTGELVDTFDLALGGPAGIVSQLSSSTVTLAPGDSQVVSISTGAINFAVPGDFELAALATSETDPVVLGGATAELNIPTTTGVTAAFSPASQTLSVPGTADFLLLVNNVGNVEDAYSASIVGSTGSVTASLAGLTGEATQTISIFRLPGLSTGAILLTANLGVIGQGTVTVQVKSLSDGTIITNATATIIVNTQSPTSSDQEVTTGEDSPLGIILTGADSNSPPLPLSYLITTYPSHGTLTGAAPNLTYIPDPGYFGPDSFAYETNNGYLDSAVSNISIIVVAPPVAEDSTVDIAENAATSISLPARDPNTPAQPLTYIITDGPTHGTLGPISGNSVVYTPDANYFGPDGFQFKTNNGASDSQVATISLNVQQANVADIIVRWGAQAVGLQTNSDGVRLLPAGRRTDLPWLNISSLAITLNQPAALSAGDVHAIGITGGSYGPVTLTGSMTNYVITFARPISRSDRVTITIGNVQIATFTRLLDVLPGDTNDDGVVNTTDGVVILHNPTPANPYQAIYDFNGDGVVNTVDFFLYRPFIGTVLPSLPPQLAVGGEGLGSAAPLTLDELTPVLSEAINEWAADGLPAADVAHLKGVTAKIAALPPGYLGGDPTGGSTIYLSVDAAGYGWFVDAAPWTETISVAATGREDLLTVLMHELGHVLGLNDLDPTAFPNDLMAETLATGVRRLPSAQDVFAVLATQRVAGDMPASGGRIADAIFGTGRIAGAIGRLPQNTVSEADSGRIIIETEHAVNNVAVQSIGKQNARRQRNAAADAFFEMDD